MTDHSIFVVLGPAKGDPPLADRRLRKIHRNARAKFIADGYIEVTVATDGTRTPVAPTGKPTSPDKAEG